jgi:hypothetical protein
LKSFTSNQGELDGSASKRLDLYEKSFQLMLENPESLFSGFGISSTALSNATGEGFYESFIFNSFMQGGVFLLLSSLSILISIIYYDFKYKLYFISIVVLLGNAVGGSNYFSMYAYPLMALIIIFAVKKQNSLSIEKNSTLNNL